VHWDNVVQKLLLLLYFQAKLPKVNNRPTGENSPNLVTLLTSPSLRLKVPPARIAFEVEN
jgi:hypothetical protein